MSGAARDFIRDSGRDPDAEPDPHALARRARSFGDSATAYADERPDYPDAAVRWALGPVADRAAPRVLDLGAGTGKLTEVLLRAGTPAENIHAVDPDPQMRAEFGRRVDGVVPLAGSAEEIPLPDGSVDAIVAGQALHWFDLDRAIPEIRRVLTPGGVLAGMWNCDDVRVPWVAGLQRIAGVVSSLDRWRQMAPPGFTRFAAAERAEFPHVQRRTAESLAATVGTHSHVLVLDDAERAELLADVRAYLLARPETGAGEFDMPIVTVAMRVVPG